MADGDIGTGGSKVDEANKMVAFVDDFVGLFRGKKTTTSNNTTKNVDLTTTESEDVSPEKALALLEKLLSSTQGLAAVSSGQKVAGLYDSTVSQQLTNDLLSQSTADIAALSKVKTSSQTGTVTDSSVQTNKKKGALEWIVCTELYTQGRMPHKFYRHGFKVFAEHSPRIKQGYYYWAVPLTQHLRKHPDSVLSAITQDVFNARAEYLAANGGCREARKTVLGFITTYSLIAICWLLSRTVARKPIDWYSQVYKGA